MVRIADSRKSPGRRPPPPRLPRGEASALDGIRWSLALRGFDGRGLSDPELIAVIARASRVARAANGPGPLPPGGLAAALVALLGGPPEAE